VESPILWGGGGASQKKVRSPWERGHSGKSDHLGESATAESRIPGLKDFHVPVQVHVLIRVLVVSMSVL
jgi:hypothetical protein